MQSSNSTKEGRRGGGKSKSLLRGEIVFLVCTMPIMQLCNYANYATIKDHFLVLGKIRQSRSDTFGRTFGAFHCCCQVVLLPSLLYSVRATSLTRPFRRSWGSNSSSTSISSDTRPRPLCSSPVCDFLPDTQASL